MRIPMLMLCLSLAASPTLAAAVPAPAAPEGHATSTPPDYAAPGPEHARLAALAGRWTSVYRVTPAPGAKTLEIPGSAEFRRELGGLWVTGDSELRMGESRILGRLLYGFDRFKQRYVFLFIQEKDTQPLFGYGVPDEKGTRITFTVPMDIPMAGRQGVPMRTVLDLSAPDRIGFEMNAPMPDGTEYQPLRIDYVRAR